MDFATAKYDATCRGIIVHILAQPQYQDVSEPGSSAVRQEDSLAYKSQLDPS
jgi:hypothetical protein